MREYEVGKYPFMHKEKQTSDRKTVSSGYTNVNGILKKLGLQRYDQVEILKKTKPRTVSDCLWINGNY